MTIAPFWTNSFALAAPIPRLAPVIITIFPLKFIFWPICFLIKRIWVDDRLSKPQIKAYVFMRNMMVFKKLFTGIVFVICTFAYSQTYAKMTATIVWDEIKQIASENGFKISATINQSAEGINIEEFSLINKASENNEFERLEIELVDIALLERSDGSVEIRPDYDQEITIKVYERNGVSSFVIKPISDSTNMIISGKVGAPDFQISSSLLGLELNEYELSSEYQGNELFEARITLDGLNSTQAFAGTKQNNPKSSFKADFVKLFLNFDIPDEQMTGLINYQLEDILVVSRQDDSVSSNSANLQLLLENGYNALGSYSVGKGSVEFDLSSPDGSLKGRLASEKSNVSSSLTEDGLIFDAYFSNGLLKLSASVLPIPIDISVKNANYGITLPLINKDKPQNFGVRLGISDLLIAQDLWGLFDPSNRLSNGPINAKIFLSGKANLFENLTELSTDFYEENYSSQIPLEVEEIHLEKLDLSIMGTSLRGQGKLTLDNEDLITYDGYPKPVGSAEFVLSGVNALVDKFINSGFIDPDTGMGARMMLSMFAIPTGDDELTSKIEFNSLGQVLANGQRLR